MTLLEVSRSRLISQQLAGTRLRSAIEMVQWFGAIQGQEYAQTKWSLGLRLPHLDDAAVEADLDVGRILRTHLLRPTWHLVAAEDIHWLLAVSAKRVHAANAYMYRQLELDDRLLRRTNSLLAKLLQENRHMTREQLMAALKKHRIEATGLRASYIMMHAELDGIVCSGQRQGNQNTYALLDERVARPKMLHTDEALAMLATRYFKSRGLATVKDFATWSGLTIAQCKAAVGSIASKLTSEEINGSAYYFFEGVAFDADRPLLHLLPIYDEMIMGYKDRSAYFAPKANAQLRYDSMVMYNGQVIGTWRRTLKRDQVVVETAFFKPLDKIQRKAFEKAVARFGEFLGLEVEVA